MALTRVPIVALTRTRAQSAAAALKLAVTDFRSPCQEPLLRTVTGWFAALLMSFNTYGEFKFVSLTRIITT
jgi:hypothetical protein